MRNAADVIVCVACQTPKPGHEAEAVKQKAAEPKKDPFAGGLKILGSAGQSSAQSSGPVFTFGNASMVKKGKTFSTCATVRSVIIST